MLDNPRDFLGIFLSPPLIVFFRGAVSLSSLSSELSGARLRQLYRRLRERFAVDNRNRLQTFRMAPATISTFPASSISRYILFPRAFPPATTNNTSADVDRVATTKLSAKLLSAWRTGHRAFLVSEVARDDYCTTEKRWRRQRRWRRDAGFLLEDIVIL